MKTVAAPAWAQDLFLDALIHLGMTDAPTLTWKVVPYSGATGTFSQRRNLIIVRATAINRTRDATILLHEVAHYASPKRGHTPAFWDIAWRLFRWAGLPEIEILRSEGQYRKGAIAAWERSR